MATTVRFADAVRVWIRVALQSFGGPAGQIAVMHRILADEKRWISDRRFLHALNYCMLLPGPEAQQLATYVGWLLHGYRGGLAAGILFVLPGFIAILALSYVYASFQEARIVEALFFGLKAAILAVVAEAVLRIGRRVPKTVAMATIAAAAFVAIFFFEVPFPAIVLAAGFAGFVGGWVRPDTFAVLGAHGPRSAAGAGDLPASIGRRHGAGPSLLRSGLVAGVCLALWLGPVVALFRLLGPANVYVQEGLFFSKAAVVTFGGAYAVLAYIAQQAVERYGWLQPGKMLDGLGLAETTPGPLIMVVQFVGFMGAYRNPGPLHPLLAGTLGAVLTTWVTFVPCFLWIFLGAPYMERLQEKRRISAALSAITAAVVGVVLNLAVWFALHVLFDEVVTVAGPAGSRLLVPERGGVDVTALGIAVVALLAITRFRAPMLPVLAAGTLVGIVARMLAG